MKHFIDSNRISTTILRIASVGGVLVLTGSLAGCSTTQSEPRDLASGSNCSSLKGASAAELYESGKVTGAQPIEEKVFKARAIQPEKTLGATMYVRADEGMSAPYLHRVFSCHAASDDAGLPNDPLHPASGEVTKIAVRSATGGFAVDVRAEDPRVGEEIWQRAAAMTERGSVEVKQVAEAESSKAL